MNLPCIAQALQRSQTRNTNRAGLFKADVCWFRNDRSLLQNADILGDSTPFHAKDLVAGFELSDAFADCFYNPGKIATEARDLRFAQTGD
jgi:hypothetical protein